VNVLVFNRISQIELSAREIIRFHVHDTGVLGAEGRVQWGGVVRPRLAWQTELLHDQNISCTMLAAS